MRIEAQIKDLSDAFLPGSLSLQDKQTLFMMEQERMKILKREEETLRMKS